MFALRVLLPGERGHEFLLVLLRLPFLALLLPIPGLPAYKPNKDYGETELEKLDELKQQVDPRRGSERATAAATRRRTGISSPVEVGLTRIGFYGRGFAVASLEAPRRAAEPIVDAGGRGVAQTSTDGTAIGRTDVVTTTIGGLPTRGG